MKKLVGVRILFLLKFIFAVVFVLSLVWIYDLDEVILSIQNKLDYERNIDVGGLKFQRDNKWLLYFKKQGRSSYTKLYGLLPVFKETDNSYTAKSDSYLQFTQPELEENGIYIIKLDRVTNRLFDTKIKQFIKEKTRKLHSISVSSHHAIVIFAKISGKDNFVYFPSLSILILTKNLEDLSLLSDKIKFPPLN